MRVIDESKSLSIRPIVISLRGCGCFPSKNIVIRQVKGTKRFSLGTLYITAYAAKIAKKS
jgi:hypothetical protein